MSVGQGWHQAPENDYRGLQPGAPDLSVGVVIPVYNRVDLLARTVAGLVHQDLPGPFRVVVADDGSEEDVPGALERFQGTLDLTIVRREHEGYGAGQARNLGAEACDAEVLVFIDADCVPDRELVRRHVAWHAAAANLVVIGARHALDTTDLTVDRLVAERLDLRQRAGLDGGGSTAATEAFGPTDWRRLLYRRTARLRQGTEAFRSLVSSNFSVRRDRFLEVGGFDEDFERWGGEDTELGWRLQNDGCFFVPEDRAINFHQVQEDAGPEAWRERARHDNDGIIRAKLPHSFYRKRARTGIRYEVPKVSVIFPHAPADRLEPLVDQLLDQTLTDWEVVFVVDAAAPVQFREELRGDARFRFLTARSGEDGLRRAIAASRGELIALAHEDLSFDRRLLARVVRHLDDKTREAWLSTGYRVGLPPKGQDHRRQADCRAIDRRTTREGLPPFRVVRRRDLARAIRDEGSASAVWTGLEASLRGGHLPQPLVGLGGSGRPPPSMFGAPDGELLTHLRHADGPRDAMLVAGRFAAGRVRRPSVAALRERAEEPSTTAEGKPVPVRYVGWVGHDNFGDEMLFRAISQLLPWADLRTTGGPGRCILLGGGTLINRGYLQQVQALENPRIERAVFGTGVANPEYWGRPKEPVEGWIDLLDTCALVGVRGPISERLLRGWGYRGPLQVIGDPALAIERPDVERVDGRIVVSLAQTRGQLWGGSDAAVFEALAAAVRAWLAEGREVHLWGASPRDDLAGFELARAVGAPDLPYTAAYRDLDEGLRSLASAGLVVGERLHAVVLAAACATPFIALEYRPKLRDFAESVDMGAQVIRTDQLQPDRLRSLASSTEQQTQDLTARLAEHVATYRERLRAAGSTLRQELQ